ncbi:MAG: hypothetical protein ABJE10_16915 [bacterium]
MLSVQCACGETVHYTADKAGLIARCRCGRPVRLPEEEPEPQPKSWHEQWREQQRGVRMRRQILAGLIFLVATIGVVMIFAMQSSRPPEARQQAQPADEP